GPPQRETEVFHPRRARRDLPAEGDARVLRARRGAEGAGRHRRGRSFIRRESRRGCRRDRGVVGGLGRVNGPPEGGPWGPRGGKWKTPSLFPPFARRSAKRRPERFVARDPTSSRLR